MLKIKDNIDLRELENFGFKEYKDSYKRDYNNGYLTSVDKQTREVLKIDYEWSFLKNMSYENSTYKIDDLIKVGYIEKI